MFVDLFDHQQPPLFATSTHTKTGEVLSVFVTSKPTPFIERPMLSQRVQRTEGHQRKYTYTRPYLIHKLESPCVW